MKNLFELGKLGIAASWRLAGLAPLSSNIIVLMYHGIPRRSDGYGVGSAAFEEHLRILTSNFELVDPKRFEATRSRGGCNRVLLTFDDGFRNNAEVAAPLLRKYRVPAIFFVSSGHCERGRVLWFAYLQALKNYYPHNNLVFLGERMNMSADKRNRTIDMIREALLGLRPHPHAMIRAIAEELPRIEDFVPESILADSFLGMTQEQVGELAADPLFSVGIHTIDHPYLTKCDDQEALRQINGNRAWLENVCGSQIDIIGYPLGDYNSAILRQCREHNINLGFAVVPILGTEELLEVPRLGVYHASTEVLRFKIKWGQNLRSLGFKIG